MYQPISFNVIRQALEWHALPVPTLRQLSFFSYDPDNVMAEYLATWTHAQVSECTGYRTDHAQSYVFSQFLDRLHNCFCEDVTIFHGGLSPIKDEFRVILYVTISREVIAAASADWLSSD